METHHFPYAQDRDPVILLVPGTPLGEGHWMKRWLAWSDDCHLVELGLWDEPHRNTWVNKLNLAIRRADRPVVIVTDEIAALALAWWVEFEAVDQESPVLGALIVNPPNVDLPGSDPRLERFGAIPREELPFTAFLVSDLEGSVAHQRALMRLARDWGACPVFDETQGGWASGWMLLQSVFDLHHSGPVTRVLVPDEDHAVRDALRRWADI